MRLTYMSKGKSFSDRSLVGKILFIVLWALVGVIVLSLVTAAAYVSYVSIQYYRIEDNLDLSADINNKSSLHVETNHDYSITSLNIGFGAYEADYDFFMDSGEMLDGKKVYGTHGKALSVDRCYKNTNGLLDAIKPMNSDFYLIQEIDTDSTRSYHINQVEAFCEGLADYSSVYGVNYHSAFLAYPIFDMFGAANSGLLTFSKYQMDSATRRSYPIDDSFPNKFFDLDRCFTVSRFQVGEKQLVIGNSHMSGYDEGGKIRNLQLEFLNAFLTEEKAKGNYVIIGGDFNHALIDSDDGAPNENVDLWFEHQQKHPAWVAELNDTQLAEGYKVKAAYNAPTCRAAEMAYKKGVNYVTTIDGFVISDNIEVSDIHNIDLEFAHSDHNPAQMTFSLKA